MTDGLPEDGGNIAEVGETAEDHWPGVRDDGLEVGLGHHARVVQRLHHLDDVIFVFRHLDDDGVPDVNDGIEEVEDVDKLLGAGREVPAGESTGVLVLPQEVEQPPGELLLDLPVLQVPRVLHGLGADETAPPTGSLQLTHAAGTRHSHCQTSPGENKRI